jgi:UDP-N-acetylmuramyl pentapeptide phosphotransferase/UDP-N-acetylglucosamine-1-phosphate transferase
MENKGKKPTIKMWETLLPLIGGIVMVISASFMIWLAIFRPETPSAWEKIFNLLMWLFVFGWGILLIIVAVDGFRNRSRK